MRKGAELVVRTVKAVESGNYPAMEQPAAGALKAAPKIFKETCAINWHQSSEQIRNFVRGLSPYPAAWTRIQEKAYKILKVSTITDATHDRNQAWITDNKTYLRFRTGNGWVDVKEFQPEGRKRMTVAEYLKGNRIE
jgi:methionyl-tRNA formyltransferase